MAGLNPAGGARPLGPARHGISDWGYAVWSRRGTPLPAASAETASAVRRVAM